jgi:hypothetical protein
LYYRVIAAYTGSLGVGKHCPVSQYGNVYDNDRIQVQSVTRPSRTARTLEVMNALHVAIVKSLQQSSRKLAQALGTSRTTVRCLLHMDLKFQPCKLLIKQRLTLYDRNFHVWFSTCYWSWRLPVWITSLWVTKFFYSFVFVLVKKIVTTSLPPISVCSMKSDYTVRRSEYIAVSLHKVFLDHTFSQMTGSTTMTNAEWGAEMWCSFLCC